MSAPRSAALALTLLLVLWQAPAGATSGAVSAIGPRSQALAGSGSSVALGYEATFQNPASLALESLPSLSVGYGVTDARLYLQRGDAPEQRVPSDLLGATQLGFALPLSFGSQSLVLGMASLSPGGSVARADLPLPEQPQFPFLLARSQAVDFDLALGTRVSDFLALGAGLRALSTLSGTARVERGKARTTTHLDDALEPVLAPMLGATLSFDEAAFGLVYRAPLRADFDVRLAAVDLGATQLPELHLAGVAHYDPLTLSAEYSQGFGNFQALFGASYQRYRDAPALLARTVQCPPERPDCAALPAGALELKDTFDLHVAARYRLRLGRALQAELRAGYAHVPSPVPEQRGSPNLLDNARHRVGLGYGVELASPLPPLGLDFGVQLEQLPARTHHKASDVPADNPGAPSLTTRGSLVAAALGLTVRL